MKINLTQKALCIIVLSFIALLPFQIYGIHAEDHFFPPISVDAKIDKTDITVGDVVTFYVTVRADSDIESSLPDFNEHFRGFELIDNGAKEPREIDGQIESVFWYQLRADLPGKYTIPPVPLYFTAPDSQKNGKTIQGQTLTPEVNLEIQSILHLQGEPADIRDIKSILDISSGWLEYLFASLFILALLGLTIWIWRLRKQSSKLSPTGQTSLSLMPHELALCELQDLQAKGYLEKGHFQEHYFELSEIFRRYMGNRFSFPALDWTLEEITLKLKEDVNSELWQQARSILEYSDLVKFAKSTPSFDNSNRTMEATISFIQSTQPAEEVKTSKV